MAGKRSVENTKKKQEWIAKLLKDKPQTTLNEAGKLVVKEFGTQLAYDKLREAYVGAGGKVDTRRGPGKGKKAGKPKAAKGKRGPRKYGKRSPEATKAKQEFVADLLRTNPDMTMNEAGKRVRAKFGTQLAFDRLKQAFTAAGGKVGKPGRRAKPRAKIDRRIGRRAADIAAARIQSVLGQMPKHVVVMHVNSAIDTNEFATREQAVAFTRNQVLSGVPVSNIAYYLRQPLEISVGI
ncbi:MAG: hypothetical protein KF696_05950 [Planctomycetes bacterium]|nr:hypothetical protein [Planctomycetota bacterium]MCW8136430.1 hypothetical protein [Planctomycetota bacterium]